MITIRGMPQCGGGSGRAFRAVANPGLGVAADISSVATAVRPILVGNARDFWRRTPALTSAAPRSLRGWV